MVLLIFPVSVFSSRVIIIFTYKQIVRFPKGSLSYSVYLKSIKPWDFPDLTINKVKGNISGESSRKCKRQPYLYEGGK